MGCPVATASCGRRAGPAAPTRSMSAGPGPEPRPALAWLLLLLLLEAGPLAAVVGALSQRSYKAQVAGDVSVGRPLVGHGTFGLDAACPFSLPLTLGPASAPKSPGPPCSSLWPLRTPLAVTSRILHPCCHLKDPPPSVARPRLRDYPSLSLAVRCQSYTIPCFLEWFRSCQLRAPASSWFCGPSCFAPAHSPLRGGF